MSYLPISSGDSRGLEDMDGVGESFGVTRAALKALCFSTSATECHCGSRVLPVSSAFLRS